MLLSRTGILLILMLPLFAGSLCAQEVYTVKADSTKLTGCDSNELIIENHTQNINGFLYNKGKGRTEFKKGIVKINDSLYLIGGDTLHYNAWIQGGNRWTATGKLGTLDEQHLDIYTHDSLRMRIANHGNVMLGTASDNGNILQVNGRASFTDSVNIGSATIAKNGNLIGTNALLYQYVIPENHNYRYNSDPYISKLENLLYNYSSRLNTTVDNSGGVRTIEIHFPKVECDTDYTGLAYPAGFMCFSFWNYRVPASVSVMVKDSATGVWWGPYHSSTDIGYGGAGFFQVEIPGSFNWVCAFKITITPKTGMDPADILMLGLEYVTVNGGQGLRNPYPYVSKTTEEHLYNPLWFRNNGIDNIKLNPYGNSYMTNRLLIGTTVSDGGTANLQVTGGISSANNITCYGNLGLGTGTPGAQLHTTGSIRFEGLTAGNTLNRVIVSDNVGNLYYRDVSSLSAAEAVHSSLVVNGPVKARSLVLNMTDGGSAWPDYVFDSGYRLPDLKEVGDYVKRYGHLPGIVSAAEVAKSGLDVGQSQAALLRKIEEMTLYTLKQDEEIRQLRKDVQLLMERVGSTQRQIVKLSKTSRSRSKSRK